MEDISELLVSSVRRAGEGGLLWQGPAGEHLVHPAASVLILYLRREQEWCGLVARKSGVPVHLHGLEDFVADDDVFDLHSVDR